jgi:hypothetical protein
MFKAILLYPILNPNGMVPILCPSHHSLVYHLFNTKCEKLYQTFISNFAKISQKLSGRRISAHAFTSADTHSQKV